VHHRFLFDELSPESAGYNREYAEYLHDLKQRFTPSPAKKANDNTSIIIINAGIIDFFKNIGTERGRALSAWEKRYPGRVKELKSATLRLIDQSEKLLSGIISVLKTMATARATRKVDDYVKHAHRIVVAYKTCDESFKSYYDTQVKKFLESQELLSPTKSVDTPTEIGSQDIGNPKSEPVVSPEAISSTLPATLPVTVPLEAVQQQAISSDPIQLALQPTVPQQTTPQQVLEDIVPPAPKRKGKVNQPGPQATQLGSGALQRAQQAQQKPIHIETRTPEQLEAARLEAERVAAITSAPSPFEEKQKRDLAALRAARAKAAAEAAAAEAKPDELPAFDMMVKREHYKFINSLEALSNEHPIILSKFILKYAQGIQISDPDTYDKLINIVNSIKV